MEFNASKVTRNDFLKIDRNPKIFLETRKGRVVSHLTSRSIYIILSSLVLIPEVSVITRQES